MILNKPLLGLLLLWGVPMQAQLTESFLFTTFNLGSQPEATELSIPDGLAVGVSDTRLVTSPSTEITSLSLSLNITSDLSQEPGGAFNGDLYVYLRHDSGFSVLLNRVGRSAASSAGYPDSGFSITLRDDAVNGDIHTHQAGAGLTLSGSWQPDGRNVDPAVSLDTTSRTAFLSVFNGLNPNGEWTLFAADLQSGGASKLESWELQITAVPEPRHWALASGLALVGFGLWRLQSRKQPRLGDVMHHRKSACFASMLTEPSQSHPGGLIGFTPFQRSGL